MGQQPTMHNGPAMPDEAAMRNRAAIELAEAMGRARNKQADEDALKADSKLASATRLEAVRAQLAPLYAAIPRDVEMFDLGMVAGEKPRLFVDIIAFIEMNRDMSTFRFMQETRSGRVLMAETSDEQELRAAVTDYIARRLIERERALAAQDSFAPKSHFSRPAQAAVIQAEVKPVALAAVAAPVLAAAPTAAALAAAPAPAMPQTANQAFERWTNATAPVTQQNPETQNPEAIDLRRGLPVQPLKTEDELAAIRQELTARERAYQQEVTKPELIKPAIAQSLSEATKHAAESHHAVQTNDAAVAKQAVHDAAQAVVVQPASAIDNMGVQTKTMVANAVASTSDAVAGNVAKVAAAATAATASLATTKALSARKTGASGWWVWPLLALLIGIGLGALLLYLYAANVLRP